VLTFLLSLQACVERLSKALWKYPCWDQLPPAATISICRADRGTVRASLRPEAVVPQILHQLQQLGWPPPFSSAAPDSTACLDGDASQAAGCAVPDTAAELMKAGLQVGSSAPHPPGSCCMPGTSQAGYQPSQQLLEALPDASLELCLKTLEDG